MIVLEVVVYRALEHLAGAGKTRVLDLCAGDIKVSAAMESLEDELNIDLALLASRYYYVVVDLDEREGCLYALDAEKVIHNL